MTQQMGERGVLSQHMGRWLPSVPYRLDPRFEWTYDNTSFAYSNDPRFWDWVVANAVEWGMSTMKQDHTDSQLLQTPRCLSEPGFGDSALAAQLDALEAYGCTLMGGGYTAKGWLHGSRHKALTHARVGADYFGWCDPYNKTDFPRQWHPNCSHGNYWSWRVSQSSLASWALGMAPYKDAWYSSSQESQEHRTPDTGFYLWHEPYPRTHALVSTLTGGPILFGDGINGSNRTLIMMACRDDGLLLKPDRPATPTDAFWMALLESADAAECRGDLSVTDTSIAVDGSVYSWLYAVGVQLCSPYNLSLGEWAGATEPFRARGRSMQRDYVDAEARLPVAKPTATLAFRPEDAAASLVELGSLAGSVSIAAGPDYGTADFWRTAPVLPNGWALLGELGKFVGVSRQRIAGLATQGASLHVALVGAPGEVVRLTAARRGGGSWRLCDVEATVGADGTAACRFERCG